MVVVDGSASAAVVRRNSVLAALSSIGFLAAQVELVSLDNLDVVHEIDQPTAAVLFPVSCVVSVAARDVDEALDVTTVGREGLVGLPGLLGASVHDTQAVCRVPGEALRLPLATARQLLVADPEGLAVLHRYIRGNVADLMQRIACNRAHGNEARCACWLLKTSVRTGSDAFELTHATLATMLGVRRATVTDNIAGLQRHEMVRSSRGTVTVLDRAALEAAACNCYTAFCRALPTTFF
ncbi:MAG: Crp/Fnr family transcriptional regulator [Janthinobacterium lividum]